MLMYLISNAHPEIKSAVHQCAWFSHVPREICEEAIKHICRYLQGVKTNRLTLQPNTSLELGLCINADFSGLWNYEDNHDPVCVKYRTGYILTLVLCPIIWSSKLQTEIELRTSKAEYIALIQAVQEIIPMLRIFSEIAAVMNLGGGETKVIKSTVFEDNNGALTTANSVNMNPLTKQISVKYCFFKHHCGKVSGTTLVMFRHLHQENFPGQVHNYAEISV